MATAIANVDVAYADIVKAALSSALAAVALSNRDDPVSLLGRLLLAEADGLQKAAEVR